MGLLEKVLWTGGAVLVSAAVRSTHRAAQETRRRINSPLCFDDGITEQEFTHIAATAARGLPRLEGVDASGMTAAVHVRSHSGLSTWAARVDFNDYGHLTGKYWLETDNTDSVIPEHFAKAMQTEIRSRVGLPHPGTRELPEGYAPLGVSPPVDYPTRFRQGWATAAKGALAKLDWLPTRPHGKEPDVR